MKRKIIIFEGFVDTGAEHEFDWPAVMVFPKRQYRDVGNVDGVFEFVEDYFIDKAIGNKIVHQKDLKKNLVMVDLEKARKGSKRLKHWRVIVEYWWDQKEEIYKFDVKKIKGFK